MPSLKLPVLGALALTLALTPVTPVMAVPAAMPPSVARAEAGRTVIEVGRRSFHRHHGHRHGGRNLAIGSASASSAA